MDVRGIEQSATLAINELSKQILKKGREVHRLGLGQSPFPVPEPVVNALKLHAHEKDYLPSKGLKNLRKAVADFHRRKDGVNAQSNLVLIGPGSKELMFLLQLVFYGELIVPTPCWVSYIPQARILGRKVSLVHTSFENQWRITAKELAAHCEKEHDQYRPRILILNYPGNPEGCSHSAEELKDLAHVARKFEVILLSDEIYGQLHHQGTHVSVARYYPEGTIISSGLSKWCGAGGWRLGTFTFPKNLAWLLETMASVASETYTSVSAPIQYAAVRAFRGGVRIERYLCHARRILSALGNQCARILAAGGARIQQPIGAFYLFPDFSSFREKLASRGIHDSTAFCERLLEETGVACLPGLVFGRPTEELTVRLAYVDFDGSKALTVSESIPLDKELSDDFSETWCPRVVRAMEKIVDWVAG
jgi:aspartate aminotransferase